MSATGREQTFWMPMANVRNDRSPANHADKQNDSPPLPDSSVLFLSCIAFGDPDYAALRLIQATQRGMINDRSGRQPVIKLQSVPLCIGGAAEWQEEIPLRDSMLSSRRNPGNCGLPPFYCGHPPLCQAEKSLPVSRLWPGRMSMHYSDGMV